MFTVNVDSNVGKASAKVQQEILRRRAELLQVLGTQLLSDVRLAFETKSRGGQGGDGIKWKPLDPKTIKAKQRRGKSRRKSRRSRRGSSGGIAGPSGNVNTQIGVDTGLLRASASPGYRGDADGGNIFKVDEQAGEVTVGFGRSYAEYFDEDRPLFPVDLPTEWENELDDIIHEHYETILEEFEE